MMIPISGLPAETYPEPLPDYGDLMTREKFISAVECGLFINDDGYGELSDGKFSSYLLCIWPSQVRNLDWPAWATHVIWFNR